MVSRRLLYYYCEPGDDVRDFQDGANAVRDLPGQSSAFAPLVVDGIFGSNSLKRAQEFQRINGLVVDGLVGDGTWGRLLGLLHGKGGMIPTDRPVGGTGGGEQAKGTPVFGKPLPGVPAGKSAPGQPPGKSGANTTGKTQNAGPFGQGAQKAGQDATSGFDPFGQKTAPGSQKVTWWKI